MKQNQNTVEPENCSNCTHAKNHESGMVKCGTDDSFFFGMEIPDTTRCECYKAKSKDKQ